MVTGPAQAGSAIHEPPTGVIAMFKWHRFGALIGIEHVVEVFSSITAGPSMRALAASAERRKTGTSIGATGLK